MKNKIFILIIVFLMMLSSVACSSDDNEGKKSEEGKIGLEELGGMFDELDELAENVEEAENLPQGDVVGCGEEFNQKDMSYSVIGARIAELDGDKYLILKMEAFNNSDENYVFSALMNVGLVNSKGEDIDLEIMYTDYEEDMLNGVILGGGNKIIGELAFNISELKSDEYLLQIGEMMELRDAIMITADDIGKTYDELFDNNGVIGEYTVGDTIEFENISITFDGVRIEPKNTYDSNYDEEGMGLMVLDMTINNNSNESSEFVSVGDFSTIRQVCAMDGKKLEYEDYSYLNRNWVESGNTKQETFGLYYDEKDKDFYLLINPDISESKDLKIVTFSIE